MSAVPTCPDWIALDVVRLRSAGHGPAEIARRLGRDVQYVSTLSNRILRADLAESGEPRDQVLASYWEGAA